MCKLHIEHFGNGPSKWANTNSGNKQWSCNYNNVPVIIEEIEMGPISMYRIFIKI